MGEITVQDLKNGMPMVLRWGGKSPFHPQDAENGYSINPGWRLPDKYDYFFTRLDEQTSLLKDCTIIPMEELDKDISYLKTEIDIDDIRALKDYPADAERVPGEQIQDIYEFTEAVPQFRKTALHVKRGVAFTEVPETFIDENLERENFLQTTGDLYMRQLGLALEKKVAFSRYNPTRPNGRNMFDSLNGIFQQLAYVDANHVAGTDEAKGFGTDFTVGNGSIIKQFMEKIEEYEYQNGKDDYNVFYVSKVLYNKVLQEVTTRETDYGDQVLRKGGQMTIFDTPLQKVDFLNPLIDPARRNNWDHLALLADASSIAVGIYNGNDEQNVIKSRTTYEHKTLNYLTSWQLAFDTLLLWEQDVLGFKVGMTETGKFSIQVNDSTNKGIDGVTVNIYSVDDPETVLQSGTTNEGGAVEIEGLDYGAYNIEVIGGDEYKDKKIEGIVLGKDLEIEVIKLAKA